MKRLFEASLSAPPRALAAVLIALASCNDFDQFTTNGDEAYCGSITLGSAFREGIGPRMQMRLELDASALDGPEPAGTLWTFEPAGDGSAARWFNGAKLRPFRAMQHDVLSRPELGDGRERSALFAVAPTDGVQSPMLAAVSLRSDAKVEVRLVRPGPAEGATAALGTEAIFGVFVLHRRTDRCGF